jgi:ABC-type nitrate/sulfonate/bicarbonate transport system permease component
MRISPQTTTIGDAHSRELEARFRRNLKSQKRRAVMMRVGLNIAGVCIALIMWELTRFLPGVNEVLFPPPSIVVTEFVPMIASGEIPKNILVSLKRAGLGFAIAALLGVATGVLTARLSVFNFLTEPLLHGARSLPAIALVPISVLWFGIGEAAKIALVCWGAFFPIWVSTFIGVRDVHPIYLRSAACLGAGRTQTLLWVILPAALPMILAGLRQSIAISLIVLVAAELSGATSGVAYMMSMGHQLFRVDIMFIGLFLLAALGFFADRLFVALTRKLFPWYASGH